jgi:hypothetical protein
MLPLVGVTWRGYASLYIGLWIVADRRGNGACSQVVPSHRTVEVGVALDRLSGWGARLLGRVIRFGIDRSGLLWTRFLVENPASLGEPIRC